MSEKKTNHVSPEGAANMYLTVYFPNAPEDAREGLVNLLKMYGNSGYKAGLEKAKELIDHEL